MTRAVEVVDASRWPAAVVVVAVVVVAFAGGLDF